MSEDTKVIDFESRAAQQRAMHTGYLVTELAGPTLKGIFDAVFIDARVDDDGDSRRSSSATCSTCTWW